MNKELLSYFNLSALPFTKEIPVEKLLHLPTVLKAVRTSRLLVETRGIGVLIGESGAGNYVKYSVM